MGLAATTCDSSIHRLPASVRITAPRTSMTVVTEFLVILALVEWPGLKINGPTTDIKRVPGQSPWDPLQKGGGNLFVYTYGDWLGFQTTPRDWLLLRSFGFAAGDDVVRRHEPIGEYRRRQRHDRGGRERQPHRLHESILDSLVKTRFEEVPAL